MRAVPARLRIVVLAAMSGVIAAEAGAADAINGQRLYRMHCAACHGGSGQSVMPMAPSFARGERLMQPDANLLASVRLGRNAMPAFVGVLNDREILDAIAFVRTLR